MDFLVHDRIVSAPRMEIASMEPFKSRTHFHTHTYIHFSLSEGGNKRTIFLPSPPFALTSFSLCVGNCYHRHYAPSVLCVYVKILFFF